MSIPYIPKADISQTIDYSAVYSTAMAIAKKPQPLLEDVCGSIITALLSQYPGMRSAQVTLAKNNPPLGGQTHSSSVTLQYTL